MIGSSTFVCLSPIIKYRNSIYVIHKLNKKIQSLENDLKKKNEEIDKSERMDTSEEAVIAKNKKDGFSRKEPQEEPLKRQKESQFDCMTCDKTLESHMFNHEKQLLKFACEFCASKYKNKYQQSNFRINLLWL